MKKRASCSLTSGIAFCNELRKATVKRLFNPLEFEDAHSLGQIRQKAIELRISEQYAQVLSPLSAEGFLADMGEIFPAKDDGTCHSRAVWAAVMAEVVGFRHVTVVMCVPKKVECRPNSWGYHTAITIGATVLDPYLNKLFQSDALWIAYLNKERPGSVQDCVIVHNADLDRWAGLYPNHGVPAGSKTFRKQEQCDFICKLEALGMHEFVATGVSINITLARNPHFIAQMCRELYSNEFGVKAPNQHPSLLAQGVFVLLTLMMINFGAIMLLNLAKNE